MQELPRGVFRRLEDALGAGWRLPDPAAGDVDVSAEIYFDGLARRRAPTGMRWRDPTHRLSVGVIIDDGADEHRRAVAMFPPD